VVEPGEVVGAGQDRGRGWRRIERGGGQQAGQQVEQRKLPPVMPAVVTTSEYVLTRAGLVDRWGADGSVTSWGSGIAQLTAAGDSGSVYALTTTGAVWRWGADGYCLLGQNLLVVRVRLARQ
jgi:hypothetical protein